MLAGLTLSLIIHLYAYAALDINTASQSELENVKGFGPVKAKAIIDYRKAHGNFKSVDELDNVNGIGPGTISKVRKLLTTSAVNDKNKVHDNQSCISPVKRISTTNGVIDEFKQK